MPKMTVLRGGTLNGTTQLEPGDVIDVDDALVETLVAQQFAALAGPDPDPEPEEAPVKKPAAPTRKR